ncbi:UNVERIFIED_CONTAM: hypothetical protein Sindi_2669900, partial [Sesamum indicum]
RPKCQCLRLFPQATAIVGLAVVAAYIAAANGDDQLNSPPTSGTGIERHQAQVGGKYIKQLHKTRNKGRRNKTILEGISNEMTV